MSHAWCVCIIDRDYAFLKKKKKKSVPQWAFPLLPIHSWINLICSAYLANYFCTRVLCFWLKTFLSHGAMGPSVSEVPNRDLGQVGVFEPSYRGPRGIWELLKD